MMSNLYSLCELNFRLEEKSDKTASLYSARVSSDGKVEWQVPLVLTVSCQMDAHYYPWDEQTCYIKFGSWILDYGSIDMKVEKDVGETFHYIESGEWDLMEYKFKHNLVYYNCCEVPYPDVTATIKLKRKPLYIFFNLIIPAFLIALLSALAIYLPPDSGEKVSLSVTILLTLVVFMLRIGNSVPPSDSIPLIGKLLRYIH